MCGILAIQTRATPARLNDILKASKLLAKRGPDAERRIIKQSGIYIFHRLAINDTSSLGQQPFTHGQHEEVLVMCNGQIWNHEELKKKYDIICRSGSDCEVLLHLYLKIGFVEMIKQLDGVYGIVLVDRDTMYVARDRIGVRPLYIGRTIPEGDVAIASTPDVLSKFCSQYQQFTPATVMSFHRPLVGTDVMRAMMTPKIEYQEWSAGGSAPPLRIACALSLARSNLPTQPTLFKQLRWLLERAVEKRLMSDRRIGAFLSGGLDSSLIVSILCRLRKERGVTEKVKTYSIGMKGSTDLYYAKIVADYLGTEHHEVLFTPEQGLSAIPRVIEALASKDITTVRASVGMKLLAEHVAEQKEDVVEDSGEGSDELLEGYLYFKNAPSMEAGAAESERLTQELYKYDCLRADRCISSSGLEGRFPFLDKDVVDFCMTIPPSAKAPKNGCEKYLLRRAFDTAPGGGAEGEEPYLPSEVLWRQKTAFSDGVSAVSKSWFQVIQEYVETKIPDEIFDEKRFPSKEAMYYHLIFEKFYPGYDTDTPYWLPKWCGDVKDPSARVLSVCTEKDIAAV